MNCKLFEAAQLCFDVEFQPENDSHVEGSTLIVYVGTHVFDYASLIHCVSRNFICDQMALKRTMKERKQLARRHEKRRNLKSALQVSIPGFEDVKVCVRDGLLLYFCFIRSWLIQFSPISFKWK